MKLKLSDKAKEIIGAVAPTLGTVLGGPLGGLGGAILAKTLGVDTEKAVEDQILQQSPDNIVKLRMAEMELEKFAQQNRIDLSKIEVEDRKDARLLAQKDMRPHIVLSAVFLGGYFAVLWMLMTGGIEVSADYKAEMSILFGVITANVPTIMAFWFGSSYGSSQKTALLAGKGD